MRVPTQPRRRASTSSKTPKTSKTSERASLPASLPISLRAMGQRLASQGAPWGWLTLCLALAAGARLLVLVRARGMLDGDEATLGILAEEILGGARPIYYPGQGDMGTWDSYLAAPLVARFGPSAAVLHAVTLGESLLLVPLLGMLAARIYGRRARVPAMLLAALPPLYVAVGELRMLGGYVETLVLGSALLLVVLQIGDAWAQGRPTWWRWAGAGLLAGLSLWIDPLVIYYLLAAALWLAPLAALRLWWGVRRLREGGQRGRAGGRHGRVERQRRRRWARLGIGMGAGALAGGSGLALGFAPAAIYALQTHSTLWQSVIGQPSAATFTASWRMPVLDYFFTAAAPKVIGARILWPGPAQSAALVALCGAVAALFALAGMSSLLPWLGRRSGRVVAQATAPEKTRLADVANVASAAPPRAAAIEVAGRLRPPRLLPIAGPAPEGPSAPDSSSMLPSPLARLDGWWPRALPPLLILCIVVIYWRAPVSAQIFAIRSPDSGGRYALPLATALTLLLSGFFARLVELRQLARWRALGVGLHAGLLAVLLVAYGVPYVTSDAVRAMQTPYSQSLTFPATDGELVAYLERRQIHDVWTSHWIGDVVMFYSDRRVLCADAADILLRRGPNRFPAEARAISASDRPSFILADPLQGGPALMRALDRMGVRYHAQRFGALWVVTPLSRTVRPEEVVSILAAG